MARTANRGTMSASSPTSYNVMRWRLGKYIRLSKEDLLRGRDESNSVVNQRRLLEQYHQEFDCAFLLITHDMDSAYRLSDTILTMQAGQIVRVGIKQ